MARYPSGLRLVSLALLLSLTATGCWSAHDPRDLTLAASFGVDTAEAGNLLLAVELVNPRVAGGTLGGAGEPRNPTRVLYSVAQSVFLAQRDLDQNIGKAIFPAEASVALVGRKLAEAGATPMLDYLTREHQLRRTISLVLADGDVPQILATPTIRDTASAEIDGLLQNGRVTGYTSGVSVNMFLADLSLPGKEPFLPVVSLVELPQAESAAKTPSAPGAGAGSSSQTRGTQQGSAQQTQQKPKVMSMNTVACFKHDKLVGILTPSETRGLLFLQNSVITTLVSVPAPPGGGYTVVEVTRSRSSIKPRISPDGSVSYEIKLEVSAEVADVPSLAETVGPLARVRELEQQVASAIEGEVSACITRMQKDFDTDCVGFGLMIYRMKPALWSQLANQWDDVFRNVPYSVAAQVRIRSTGTIGTGIEPRREIPR